MATINYRDIGFIPNVTFTYDTAGNRAAMTETGRYGAIRETAYGYDDVRRLTSVGFDADGDRVAEQTVSYQYDAGGLRTKLTLPGSLNIGYSYDQRGQLISLDRLGQPGDQFAYDNVGDRSPAMRDNGLRSRYEYDAGGRLTKSAPCTPSKTLAQFIYTVDARGNRTRRRKRIAHPATTNDVTIAYNDSGHCHTGNLDERQQFQAINRNPRGAADRLLR